MRTYLENPKKTFRHTVPAPFGVAPEVTDLLNMMFVISVSSADVVVALSGSCSHFIVVDDMQADDDIKAFFV